jgi:hypothetical protein
MDEDGTYRVLPETDDGRRRLLDRETYEPVVLAAEGHDAPVVDLRAGYLVDAALDWSSADPTVESLTVARPTLYTFADEVDPMFELAQETWEDARASGDGMSAQQTRNTDGAVNGVVYVFAESGDRGRFEEFRDGTRPLEPLVDRVNDGDDAPEPREVFVLRDLEGAFTAVTITLAKDGQFAETIRDTYDRPRPDEPLV